MNNRRSLIQKLLGALALFLPAKLFAQKDRLEDCDADG